MTAAPDTRKRELAMIHVAKAQLGLDEETYRAMLWSVGLVKSSADLDWTGRKKVLDHLKARGFKAKKSVTSTAPNEWGFIDRAAPDRQAMLRKICAMCRAERRPKAYADKIAKTMWRVSALEFAAPDQLHGIIASLARDADRQAAKAGA